MTDILRFKLLNIINSHHLERAVGAKLVYPMHNIHLDKCSIILMMEHLYWGEKEQQWDPWQQLYAFSPCDIMPTL